MFSGGSSFLSQGLNKQTAQCPSFFARSIHPKCSKRLAGKVFMVSGSNLKLIVIFLHSRRVLPIRIKQRSFFVFFAVTVFKRPVLTNTIVASETSASVSARSRAMKLFRRILAALAIIAVILLIAVLALNLGGRRALIQARLLRIENQPTIVPPPPNFKPRVPPGFQTSTFATGFASPRWLAVAPNGDIFVADSSANAVIVLRNSKDGSKAESREIFADHLNLPFGIAFHDDFVYIANTNEVVRFRYDPATSKR